MNAAVAVYIYTLVPEFLMRFMAWMLIHSVYRLEKSGLEHIPDEGPGAHRVQPRVLRRRAGDHRPRAARPIRWVMDHRIFSVPLLSFFFRTARAIPIAPAREDPETLERAYDAIAQALERGELVGIFPEGRLTRDGEIAEFRGGVHADPRAHAGAGDADGAVGAVGQPLRAPRGKAQARAGAALPAHARCRGRGGGAGGGAPEALRAAVSRAARRLAVDGT